MKKVRRDRERWQPPVPLLAMAVFHCRRGAVALVDLVDLGYHSGHNRLLGCCGPSGNYGRNRICGCGSEVGTEQSDCTMSEAVDLDTRQVVAYANEPTA